MEIEEKMMNMFQKIIIFLNDCRPEHKALFKEIHVWGKKDTANVGITDFEGDYYPLEAFSTFSHSCKKTVKNAKKEFKAIKTILLKEDGREDGMFDFGLDLDTNQVDCKVEYL